MRAPLSRALLALALLTACTDNAEEVGIVEVYWQFDDADLNRIFPQGERADTCAFASNSSIRFDLRVRLTIIENTEPCLADPSSSDCQILDEPLLFPCNRFRGTAKSVPVSADPDGTDPGYLMVVEAVIDPTDSPPFVPDPSCLAGPGPRVRGVKPGRITDLEVYQFIVSGLDAAGTTPLDIDACRPSESGDGDGDGDTTTDTSTDSTT